MAQQINTRIQLKHDSLTNWNQSSIVLKPGEVGVAYVDVATKDAKGNIIHVPTALLKVGENKENSAATFKDLPFVSALAADVYGWAKENGIYVETTGEGEAIANVEWKATEAHPNGALVITKTDVVTPAELSAELAKYYTKTEINTLFAGYYTKSEIDNKIQTINGTNAGLAERVESLETTRAGHGDIVTHNVAEFATAAQGALAEAAASKTYVDEEFAKYTKTNDLPKDLGELTNNAGYAKTADVNTELDKKADKTQVATDIANAIAPLATTKALNGVDAKFANYTNTTDMNAKFELKADKTALEATDKTLADVKATVDNFFAEDAAVNDTIDTLKEIAAYIATDKEGAADIAARVGALEGKVDVEKVSTAIADAVKGEADRATASEGVLSGRIDTLEAIDHDAYKAADTALHTVISKEIDDDVKNAIDAEVLRAEGAYDKAGAAAAAQAAAIADAASKYETQGTAQGIVDGLKLAETYEPIGAESRAIAAAKTETQNQISALNISQYETSAHAEATYRKAADKITSDDMSDEVWVFNCGTSTTVI